MSFDRDGFARFAASVRNWGRWGPDDQRGTLNLITSECLVEATRVVRTGKMFDLGIPLDASGPQIWTESNARINPIHLMSQTGIGQVGPGPVRFVDDFIFMPLQSATQWDALGHCHYEGRMYNGYPASEATVRGLSRNGIDSIGTGVAGRGVLLDIPGQRGVSYLDAGEVIAPADLDAAAAAAGLEVRTGDIVLIRTGWYDRFASGELDAATFLAGEPGLSLACAQWLHDHEVAAVAADNFALEVVPFEDPELAFPLHMVLIRDMGMTIGEIFDLRGLAADSRDDGVYEFFFTAPPLKVTGGAGTPINPLAIK